MSNEPAPSSRRAEAPLRRILIEPPPPPRHKLVIPIVAVYAAVIFAWLYLRHRHYGSATFELGSQSSVLWALSHKLTAWNSVERVHQWSNHFEIALLPLAVLFRITSTPVWLFLVHAIAMAATALPIEAIARRVTRDPVTSLVATFAVLFMPQLALASLADFHPLALTALPLAVMVWGIEANVSRAVAIGAITAILIREQMGLLVAAAAVAWWLRHGKRRLIASALLAAIGLSAFFIAIFAIVPSFGSGGESRVITNYQSIGGSAGEAMSTAGTSPLKVLSLMVKGGRPGYLARLGAGAIPLLLLALIAPRKCAWPLLIALPQIGIQLVSDKSEKWDIRSHYGAPVVPLIAASAALALGHLPALSKLPEKLRAHAPKLAAAVWLVIGLAVGIKHVPTPIGRTRPIDPTLKGSKREAALVRALGLVPKDASISAQDNMVPHLANRVDVHMFPDGARTDDFILIDGGGPARNFEDRKELVQAMLRLRADPKLELLVDEAGVILAKRADPEAEAPPK